MLPEAGLPARIALFALDLEPAAREQCASLLDADERARATRFRRDADRNRFIARRGQLRRQLALELDADPATLRIVPDTYGKPVLLDEPGLFFNLSHSNGVALCATSRAGPVGCDVEWRNPELACAQAAERLFAPAEVAALRALPPEQWVAGFYNCWTRKEAYVKALGLGLSHPLHAFEVSLTPDEPASLLSAEPGWTLTSFEPAPGYQAALVTIAE